MKLTKEQIDILKKMILVNNSICLRDKTISVKSADNSTTIYYDWNVDLERDVPIYDMNEFLKLYIEFKNPVIEYFNEYMLIKSEDGVNELIYNYADIIYMNIPKSKEEIFGKILKHKFTEFSMTKEQIQQLNTYSKILSHEQIKFGGKEIVSLKKSNPSSNTYKIKIECENNIPEFYISSFSISSLISDDYNIKIIGKDDKQPNVIVFKPKNISDLLYCAIREKGK